MQTRLLRDQSIKDQCIECKSPASVIGYFEPYHATKRGVKGKAKSFRYFLCDHCFYEAVLRINLFYGEY